MKSLNLTILLCICYVATIAQQYIPMPTGKATWNYRSSTTINTTPTQYRYEYFLLIQTGDDTTINSTVYKKIMKRSWDTIVTNSVYTPPAGSVVANHPDVFTAGLREDSKKVYIYNDASLGVGMWRERLMYDFTANVGDTLTHINFINWNDSLLEVKSIDSIAINGTYHKRFRTQRINQGGDLDIIEGIGTDKGLISYLFVPFCNCPINFQCFTDDNTSFGAAAPCYYVWPQSTPTDVADMPGTKTAHVYPVPFSTTVTIEPAGATRASLYNILGAEVWTQHLNGKTELQTSYLPAGTYILKLTDETNQTVFAKRIIKD